jgi:hypothetical protein
MDNELETAKQIVTGLDQVADGWRNMARLALASQSTYEVYRCVGQEMAANRSARSVARRYGVDY